MQLASIENQEEQLALSQHLNNTGEIWEQILLYVIIITIVRTKDGNF